MSLSRRHFLATTALTATSLSVMGARKAFAASAQDIRIATIGVRGRGKSHLDGLRKNIVAICDVDEEVLNKVSDKFDEEHGTKVDRVVDYRELLDRNDIDAITIATPNHTHALITVAAIQAGKDVYTEKPTAQTIWESRQMVNAARKYNKVVQVGTQARSSECIRQAVDYIQSGKLGKIRYGMGTCYKPRPSIGKRDTPLSIPKSIHYDLWCGPAEKKDIYRNSLHYDWHWDFNTGNGDMGNQGIHQMDVTRWLMGVDHLAPKVTSIGGRLGYDDAGNTPNTQVAFFEYEDAPLIFETRGLPVSKAAQKRWGSNMDWYRGMQIASLVQCEQGYVLVDNSYNHAIAYDNEGNELEHWRGGASSHFGNWLEAVANRTPDTLHASIREGHLSSALCFMGSISHNLGEKRQAGEIAREVAHSSLLSASFDRMAAHLRANEVDIDDSAAITLGASLQLDPQTEMFVDNDAANQLRTREQRAPFLVPDLEDDRSSAVGG